MLYRYVHQDKVSEVVVSIQEEDINVDTTLVGYRAISRNARGGCA